MLPVLPLWVKGKICLHGYFRKANGSLDELLANDIECILLMMNELKLKRPLLSLKVLDESPDGVYDFPAMKNSGLINVLLNLLRVGLGLFFLVTGILKVPELGETAEFLTRSQLLPEWCSLPLACTGIAMELVVAVCLVFRLAYRGAAAWGAVMTFVFLFLYAQAWIRGLELSCNCLGSTHEIVNYPQDTGARLLLMGAMLLLMWDSRRVSSGIWQPRKLDFSDTL